jgi:hypothetical protein
MNQIPDLCDGHSIPGHCVQSLLQCGNCLQQPMNWQWMRVPLVPGQRPDCPIFSIGRDFMLLEPWLKPALPGIDN